MRNIIIILLLITAFGLNKANAQKGLNNNSDLRVPVPGSISTTAPYMRVIVPAQPTMPSMPGIPSISPIASLPSGGLMPLVPSNPALPVGPNGSVRASSIPGGSSSVNITGALPKLPTLPPLSPIPPNPEIRVP